MDGLAGIDGDNSLGVERLRGRGLRFVLVDELRRRGQLSVSEMVAMLAGRGYELLGRPSKTISDALRWERARGRVIRVSRGIYAYGWAPPSTARRIRIFAERCNTWIVALMRGEQPPPTPPTAIYRRSNAFWPPDNPNNPPWQHLQWLWST